MKSCRECHVTIRKELTEIGDFQPSLTPTFVRSAANWRATARWSKPPKENHPAKSLHFYP